MKVHRFSITQGGRLIIQPLGTYPQRVIAGFSNDLGRGLSARAIQHCSIAGLPVVIASALADLTIVAPLSFARSCIKALGGR